MLMCYEATRGLPLVEVEIETLKPVEYYCKLPVDVARREVIVVDPMPMAVFSEIYIKNSDHAWCS